MSFQDHFSRHSQAYATYRPAYPGQLFSYLAALLPERQLAWDCATGNGQAATALGSFFGRVVASDASQKQIANAIVAKGVSYLVTPAECSGLVSKCCDLITVAQALHWFDLDLFFCECSRVLKKNGIFAAWCYNLLRIEPGIDQIISNYYFDVVGPFWPPERKHVESGYSNIKFPFAELSPQAFDMTARWSLAQLTGYLNTWSATQRYQARRKESPLLQISADLQAAWGAPEGRRMVTWPLSLRVGRL